MEVFSFIMAVQYTEGKGVTTWLSLFKKQVVDISPELDKLFKKINDGTTKIKKVRDFNHLFDVNNIKDSREDLEKFFTTVYKGGDVSKEYQKWMIDSGKATSKWSIFTEQATSALKSFGAGLASMAINVGISLIVEGIIQLITYTDRMAEKAAELLFYHFTSQKLPVSYIYHQYRQRRIVSYIKGGGGTFSFTHPLPFHIYLYP